MSIDIRPPAGMSPADLARWNGEVEGIKTMFEYELCYECGRDIDDHAISPSPLGNAMAWCKR